MSRNRQRRQDRRRAHTMRPRANAVRAKLALGAGLSAGATLAMGGGAHADSFQVTSTADSGGSCPSATTCTLRDAIDASNAATANPNTITFASALSGDMITLTGGALPTITYPVTISGPGAGELTISGDDASRIFNIDLSAAGGAVGISGLVLTGASNPSGVAGAIYDENAALTVDDAVITGNDANDGAGMFITKPGSLSLTDSTVSGTMPANSREGSMTADRRRSRARRSRGTPRPKSSAASTFSWLRCPTT